MSIAFKNIKRLVKEEKYARALKRLDALLRRQQDRPYHWTLRGDLIQLYETQDGPPLKEAAVSYLKALKLDPFDLYAIKSLARFYDAVSPRPATAKRYAEAYIAKAKRGLAEMESIIAEEA
jgi:predicted Zn-dependent protease